MRAVSYTHLGFRIALIDFSLEKIGKMDVGKQRGSSLYPSSQVF